jgi:integrase/recombinase XerD
MSALRAAIERYLALRRRLGYTLRDVASGLRAFAAFAESEGACRVTTDLALRWATRSTCRDVATVGTRLQMVRGFARWRSATDPHTEVPPANLVPTRYQRKPPYVYRDEQIAQLLRAAAHLPSPAGLRGLTYVTLFGLLVATGLRIAEVVGLDEADVNLEDGILTLRRTKFGKSRLVPVHPSTVAALAAYARTRDRLVPRRLTDAFFVSERGARITHETARYTFARVSGQIGLRAPVHGHHYGHGPRLHDLRHRFAACTLVDWYRAGVNVEQRLPYLATYLGHVHVNDTYWYLEAVPELLELATQRLLDDGKELAP